jgi:hypothetical protein
MKERTDFALKDTEKIYDAIRRNNTHVKDYSLTHTVKVTWRASKFNIKKRFLTIHIGDEEWRGSVLDLAEVIDMMVEGEDKYGKLPYVENKVPGFKTESLTISTIQMNNEARRDHVACIFAGDNRVLVDLEELLKATRYA